MTDSDPSDHPIPVTLPGHPKLWALESTLRNRWGPLMPEPDHWKHGWFADSYAHICSDGLICRYHEPIGTFEDLEFEFG